MGQKTLLDLKKCWVKKSLRSEKRFGSEKILGQKKFKLRKNFWSQKNFWSKNYFGKHHLCVTSRLLVGLVIVDLGGVPLVVLVLLVT